MLSAYFKCYKPFKTGLSAYFKCYKPFKTVLPAYFKVKPFKTEKPTLSINPNNIIFYSKGYSYHWCYIPVSWCYAVCLVIPNRDLVLKFSFVQGCFRNVDGLSFFMRILGMGGWSSLTSVMWYFGLLPLWKAALSLDFSSGQTGHLTSILGCSSLLALVGSRGGGKGLERGVGYMFSSDSNMKGGDLFRMLSSIECVMPQMCFQCDVCVHDNLANWYWHVVKLHDSGQSPSEQKKTGKAVDFECRWKKMRLKWPQFGTSPNQCRSNHKE